MKKEQLTQKIQEMASKYLGDAGSSVLVNQLPDIDYTEENLLLKLSSSENTVELEVAFLNNRFLVDYTVGAVSFRKSVLPLKHVCFVELREDDQGAVLSMRLASGEDFHYIGVQPEERRQLHLFGNALLKRLEEVG